MLDRKLKLIHPHMCKHRAISFLSYQSSQIVLVCAHCKLHWAGSSDVCMPDWVFDRVHDYVMMHMLLWDDAISRREYEVYKARTKGHRCANTKR